MQNNDKKVLLRISNLKQYFPLKGGRFVKANDGITLDIYEGETFGLVGESGCGKSTLGRTILQLYHQTPSAPRRSSTPSTANSTLPASWQRMRCWISQRSSAASSWLIISIP